MNARLSILTFPQQWENNQLTLRVLVMPRNFNPLLPNQFAPGAVAWTDVKMALEARFVTNPEIYPSLTAPAAAVKSFPLAGITMPANTAVIFKDLEKQLTKGGTITATTRLQKAENKNTIRKYLPESYQNSFNFTSPRTRDAVTDDSYHCALRDKPDGAFVPTTVADLSWGKVFAYCLRQPALARRLGFIYEATVAVDPAFVKDGSWLYVDLHPTCSYHAAVTAANGQRLVKRYAAKLPKLKNAETRSLFAAVQFPLIVPTGVGWAPDDVTVQPVNFDELLMETQQYDDGFCKIVHANQPISSDLLREKEDKDQPVITDAGIRLGWDDEQLLIWMNRQLKEDESRGVGSGLRIDAPMGVMQYRVDVRLQSDEDVNPNAWQPLCLVRNKADLVMAGQTIDAADRQQELGVEVYPTKPVPGGGFWLPQYFANWIGNSLVLADKDAHDIFKKDKNTVPNKQASKYDVYDAAGLEGLSLLYGNKYEFRVRLADVTGGGPDVADTRRYDAPAPEGKCDFRRYVQPQAVRMQTALPVRDDEFFTGDELTMKRPLLGYPSVLFTGQYPAAVADLIADAEANLLEMQADKTAARPVGLPDPDVVAVEVLVEVKALDMDLQLRANTDSKESYAKLYSTKRNFTAGFADDLSIPLTFVDAPVLNLTPSQDLGILGLVPGGDNIDDHADIVLPTSRDVRITIRPMVDDKEEYYADTKLVRQGKPVTIVTRRAATNETGLLKALPEVDSIRGIWLQPDTDTYLKATTTEIFVENNNASHASSMMDRLADALDKTIEVEAKGMSLVGKRGSRLQFGCCRSIRHNLSPDSTSITVATKSDLLNQWIVPLTFIIARDWTWDGLQPISFKIYRQKKFVGAGLSPEEREAIAWEPAATEWGDLVGDIEVKQAINIQALYDADRSQTYCCFLDAVEPKPKDAGGFPEEIMVRYQIRPAFKSIPNAVDVAADDIAPLQLHLPITTKPAQVPRIVSAGIAQSRYVPSPDYSSTEPRRRYLWIELAEPLQNKADAYFIRLLAYSPDPLLAQWKWEMLKAPEEAPLPLNPEPIRLIGPQHTDDKAGLTAMQEMTKAESSDVHYLVPLPPGMHASSPELFGFFTYELRVGHKRGWCTAQSRFGRQLRTTGVQHPPPQLFGIINRNEKHIMVTAPYAQTVFNGADVTSNPPRTQLWALLYAQVKRADDKAYRNILLDDQLFIRKPRQTSATGAPKNNSNTDGIQYGITGWKNKDVEKMLLNYGLPVDSALSVLVVEMLPTYDKFWGRPANRAGGLLLDRANAAVTKLPQGMFVQRFGEGVADVGRFAAEKQWRLEQQRQSKWEEGIISQAEKEEMIRPLTEQLGSQRILRTSTLVPVPEICCAE